MRNLFKPIIIVVCLLLTMSAFGHESASESERLASEIEIYDQLREKYSEREKDRKVKVRESSTLEYFSKDAHNGLRLLNLDPSDFTEEIVNIEIGHGRLQLFLYSSQHVCKYRVYMLWNIFGQSLNKISLSCFDKQDNGSSELYLSTEKCFLCD